MNQSTHGDTKHDAQAKTQISSTLLVTRSSTKRSLTKPNHFVLVKQERTLVQYEQSVYGMQSDETSLMEFGEDSATENETP
jgi:hypothetical protein